MASSAHTSPIQWPLYHNNEVHFVYEAPWWSRVVLLVDVAMLLPLFVIFNYTLPRVYPVFAIVQDRKREECDPIILDNVADERGFRRNSVDNPSRIESSSPAAIYRLLVDTDGFLANFRGLSCALLQGVVTIYPVVLVARYWHWGGSFLVRLSPALVMVQFSTLWLHLVITKPSKGSFWRRVPPFGRTFEATWRAVVVHWASVEVTRWLPYWLAASMGIDWPHFNLLMPDNIYAFRIHMATGDLALYSKCALVILVTVIGSICLVVPSQVVLMRIQASLLPIEDDTIIPFDRSFDGKVVPCAMGGRGYATMSDAFRTYTWACWKNLLILSIKIIILSLSLVGFVSFLLIAQWSIIIKRTVEPNMYNN
ncbi:hypothetical protein BBK36DRAFT_1171531 [Trichoderma citrinoviride]|uniref:Ubiquitin carrier protein n=1 Tax=Trichoderma citrinoviride TaxID=58853 RepID=A0A2T4B1T8_9HYPO|nr:hypothetical protein BBK36DRAFT_1171531 [Trichoderma citrinoviride]PTB63287.1 hypothetical protein BBK36DRAFT_1171531 [Trichoderma citrinoviride]